MSSHHKMIKWPAKVTKRANVLGLDENVFKLQNPYAIAVLLKISTLKNILVKETPFQFAMSMLKFHIKRAGKKLSSSQYKILKKTKAELRKLFHRDEV